METGFIADREPRYFTEYDANELKELGYSDAQLTNIREGLAKLGLYFKGESAKPKAVVEESPTAIKR